MGEKTEQATPKKLRDARKKGQVAKSQDFPSAFTFVASIALTMVMAPTLFGQLSDFFLSIYSLIPNLQFEDIAAGLMQQAMTTILLTTLPILGMVAITGTIVNFLIIGPVFALESFKPDIKKFDPISNLKQKFKMKTLIELGKNVLKISIAGYLIYTVMWDKIPDIISTARLPISATIVVFGEFLTAVVMKVGLFFALVAIFDLFYQKYNFAKEMKMEKHEVKQEYKNTEGDPIIKGKRKEIAKELAYSAGPEENVSMAKAIVTNPTHLAIAIGYEADEDPAPYILAMGEGHIANLIIKEADKHEVPVLRNIDLAHKLYDDGKVFTYVPIETYDAIAEILRWIENLKNGDSEDEPATFDSDIDDLEKDI